MIDYVKKEEVIKEIKMYFHKLIDKSMYECDAVNCSAEIIKTIDSIPVIMIGVDYGKNE